MFYIELLFVIRVFFTAVGGKSIGDLVRSSLSKWMSDALMDLYNVHGQGKLQKTLKALPRLTSVLHGMFLPLYFVICVQACYKEATVCAIYLNGSYKMCVQMVTSKINK